MGDCVILFGNNLLSRSNLLSSKAIMLLTVRLLFFGVHIGLSTRCKICLTLGLFENYFSLKSVSLSLKSHMTVPLS